MTTFIRPAKEYFCPPATIRWNRKHRASEGWFPSSQTATPTECDRCSGTEDYFQGWGMDTASKGGERKPTITLGDVGSSHLLPQQCMPTIRAGEDLCPSFPNMDTTKYEKRGGGPHLQGWRLISKGGDWKYTAKQNAIYNAATTRRTKTTIEHKSTGEDKQSKANQTRQSK